jgi:diaminopimelate epimerase
VKYQALGNDYLVVERVDFAERLSSSAVRRICDRHFGIGSDGILVREPSSDPTEFRLRILNPDGSEAEKSGNGLRIFARYLWDQRLVSDAPFKVVTPGGAVLCHAPELSRWSNHPDCSPGPPTRMALAHDPAGPEYATQSSDMGNGRES